MKRALTFLQPFCGPQSPPFSRWSGARVPFRFHHVANISKAPLLRVAGCTRRSSHTSGSSQTSALREKNKKIVLYALSVVVGALGATYASVPLYKIFCQATGFGGTTQVASEEKRRSLLPAKNGRPIRITFHSSVSDMMPWSFRPQQREVTVVPGETALAFYTAKNKSSKNITGVATYNVSPPQTGVYFNKIQCFCFEEQRLRGKEEIDMPVFFFIDPEILDDPTMDNVNNITLSYTFFKTDEDEAEE